MSRERRGRDRGPVGAPATTTRPRLVRPVVLLHCAGPLSPAGEAFRTIALPSGGGTAGRSSAR
jgi:hypothetical protein